MLLKHLLALLLLCSSLPLYAANERIALVIGNSNYSQVGSLENPLADAKNINNSLLQMGYKTKLVIDATESTIRKEVRKFAADSEGASIAVVFYAGHGAQINGENYLLPVDIEIPKRESDVQLSSIKVDDIINSLKSKTKIVFLDACRDNPVLIKNLSSGRGSFRGGLAAAKNSSLDESSGGVFIAYATDAGNVAADGQGQTNSPFTTALLQYIKQPVSIDDMFSMVVKEVRAKTNNKQKPYKYASLDGIVCLPGYCGIGAPAIVPKKEESPQIIVPPKIEKPEPPLVSNALPLTEWAIFNSSIQPKILAYLDIGSIKKRNERTSFRVKYEYDPDTYIPFLNQKSKFNIFSLVVDCEKYKGATYQIEEFDSGGNRIKELQYGIPETIVLGTDLSDVKSWNYSYTKLACDPNLYAPIISTTQAKSGLWKRYFKFPNGSQAEYLEDSISKSKQPEITSRLIFDPIPLSKVMANAGLSGRYENFINTPSVNSLVTRYKFNCEEKSYSIKSDNFYDQDGRIVAYQAYLLDVKANSFQESPTSSIGQLRALLCR